MRAGTVGLSDHPQSRNSKASQLKIMPSVADFKRILSTEPRYLVFATIFATRNSMLRKGQSTSIQNCRVQASIGGDNLNLISTAAT